MVVTKKIKYFLGFMVVSVLDTYQDFKELVISVIQIILYREFNIRTYLLAFK
jgi:hypothetical protein